jgi:hypothetical protein
MLRDLKSGTLHHVWHGLTYDLTSISAPMGTYPSFAFTPSDDAVIIWAAGQIYYVPLTVNARGERVSAGTPTPIRFETRIEKRLASTLRGETDIVGLETQDAQRVYAFKELAVDDEGTKAAFQAAGVTYVQEIGKKHAIRIPALNKNAPYYSPSFVHGASDLVIHARWSDTNFSTFELSDLHSGAAYELTGLPLGRYFSPVLCECKGEERQIAFIKTAGDLLTGNSVATAGAGLYIGDITLPSHTAKVGDEISVKNLRFIPSEIDTSDLVKLRFVEKNSKLLVQQSSRAFLIDLGSGLKEFGQYAHHTLASGKMSSEIVVAASRESKFKGGNYVAENVAFVDFYHVYFAPGSSVGDGEPVWSKPGNATKGLVRLSLDGGHDVTFSRNGKTVFWFLGNPVPWFCVFRRLTLF